MKKILLAVFALLTISAVAAPAVPSIHEVYMAATTGHLQQAQADINRVLAAYPNSAKAHYVDARVLALEGQWSRASQELATAQRLDPGLPFEHRDTLAAFQRQLAAHGASGHGAPSSFPMLTVVGGVLAALAVLVLIAVYRRSQRPQPVQVMPAGWPQAGPGVGMGMQPGAYPQAPQAGPGGSFLGAVGTGIGMGAGFAAGEMLVDKLFDRNNPGASQGGGFIPDANAATPIPDDQDFGVNDPGSWSDDNGGMDDSSGWS